MRASFGSGSVVSWLVRHRRDNKDDRWRSTSDRICIKSIFSVFLWTIKRTLLHICRMHVPNIYATLMVSVVYIQGICSSRPNRIGKSKTIVGVGVSVGVGVGVIRVNILAKKHAKILSCRDPADLTAHRTVATKKWTKEALKILVPL